MMIVETCGMSGLQASLRVYRDEKGDREVISGSTAEAIDRQVNTIILEAQVRAAKILTDHRAELESVREELMRVKTIESSRVNEIIEAVRVKYAGEFPKV